MKVSLQVCTMASNGTRLLFYFLLNYFPSLRFLLYSKVTFKIHRVILYYNYKMTEKIRSLFHYDDFVEIDISIVNYQFTLSVLIKFKFYYDARNFHYVDISDT